VCSVLQKSMLASPPKKVSSVIYAWEVSGSKLGPRLHVGHGPFLNAAVPSFHGHSYYLRLYDLASAAALFCNLRVVAWLVM
jgi:hypothetical protein